MAVTLGGHGARHGCRVLGSSRVRVIGWLAGLAAGPTPRAQSEGRLSSATRAAFLSYSCSVGRYARLSCPNKTDLSLVAMGRTRVTHAATYFLSAFRRT